MSSIREEDFYDEEAYRRPRYPIWVECVKVFLLFYPIMIILYYLAYEFGGSSYKYFWYVSAYLLVPILGTIDRRLTGNVFLFLVPFAAMGYYVYRAPHIALAIGGGAMVIGVMVYCLWRQIAHQIEEDAGTGMLLINFLALIAVYLIASYRKHTEYGNVIMAQGLIFSVLYLFYQHEINLMSTLKAIDKGSNFSTKQVMRFNTGIFMIYILIAVAVFFILYYLHAAQWLWIGIRALGLLLRKVLRALFSLFSSDAAYTEEAAQQQQLTNEMSELVQDNTTSTALIWTILMELFKIVLAVLAVYVVIKAVVAFVKRYKKSYKYQGKNYTEEKDFYTVEKHNTRKASKVGFFDFSPEARVRKEYYRLVRRRIDKDVGRSDTPEEVSAKIPDVSPILADYEAVRYGDKKL